MILAIGGSMGVASGTAQVAGARADTRQTAASTAGITPSVTSQIVSKHAELDGLNYFEVLGIPETADREAIRQAFRHSAQLFHPDRLRGEHEHLRPLAAKLFSRITEAYRVLDDDAARERYLISLVSRQQTNPERGGAAHFDPQRAFQTARISMKRGRLEEALLLARRARDADPEKVEYQALHAWLRVERGELRSGSAAREILNILNLAVRERRDDLEIRLYRARVLSRIGRSEEAVRDFSVVAKADPRNVEAARELRLHRMRSTDKQPLRSGVFSKLFSR